MFYTNKENIYLHSLKKIIQSSLLGRLFLARTQVSIGVAVAFSAFSFTLICS
jgi:hypothetical protein